MNSKNLVVLSGLLIFVFGCGLLQKLKPSENKTEASPSPSTLATVTPSPDATGAGTSSEGSFHELKDLLAFASGTTFAIKPPEHLKDTSYWGALGLIDEVRTHFAGWAMDGGGEAINASMVLEMPAQTTLKTLVFDTGEADEKTSAKDIVVEISDVSATAGFEQVLAITLADKTDEQVFELQKQIPGRWLRLTVKSNYGSTQLTEIMELSGYGDQVAPTSVGSISGTYKSTYGSFHIKQDGTSVRGCYEYNNGLFDGGIDGRVIKMTWSQGKDNDRHGGPAVMIVSEDGKRFVGAFAGENFATSGYAGEWDGEKISDKVGNCPQAPDLDKENAAKDTIGSDLKEKGRATVYGINFDFNSDVIRQESKPTLDQIAALLKENPDWKMTVEGHTDNLGGQQFNQSLSERRAAAVVNYLTSAGIQESRLTSAGFGYSKPIANNNTEFGRGQNRRVELVKN
jgi:OmpA-OmpF porin, OOP family